MQSIKKVEFLDNFYYFNVIEPDVLGQVYEQYLGYVAKAVKPKPQLQQTFFPTTEEQIEISAKNEKRKKGGNKILLLQNGVRLEALPQANLCLNCRALQERTTPVNRWERR